MDKDTKRRAMELPIEKKDDPTITYSSIEPLTGHGRRQPVRPGKSIDLNRSEKTPGYGSE